MADTRYTFDSVVRALVTLMVFAGILWILNYTASVVIPFVLGLLLAYLLNPLVSRIDRRVRNRPVSVAIGVTGVLAVVVAATWIVLPMLSAEVGAAANLIRTALQEDSPLAQRGEELLPPGVWDRIREALKSEAMQAFVQGTPDLVSLVLQGAQRLIPRLLNLLSGAWELVGLLLQALLVLVYLVFFLIDFQGFRDSWKDYLPRSYRSGVVQFLSDFQDAMGRYFRGQFMVASSVAVLFAVGFSLVGLRLGILLGLFIGALNMVPYLQIVGLVPAFLLAGVTAIEAQASFWPYALGTTGVFVAVQALQDFLLTPRLMGSVTGLRPVVILFAVFFWGRLLGFLGLVLAIPLTCLGLAYYQRMLQNGTPEPSAQR